MAEMINENKSLVVTSKQNEMVKLYLGDLEISCNSEKSPLTQKQKEYCVPILHNFCKRITEAKYNPKEINTTDFLEQVKHYSKLGLSIQNKELYLDFRKNGKTNMIDCTISKQYQGIQKEMIMFCSKPIIRFLHGVICESDVFISETDFTDGTVKITKHIKGKCSDRHLLKNITGAYAIAYCQENGTLVPYMAVLDKQRIKEAYNAAQTKVIWDKFSKSMVLKTAYWVLYNNILKPYMNIPTDKLVDWEATNDKMVWDNPTPTANADDDTIYDIEVNDDDFINVDVETGEILDETEEEIESECFEVPYKEYTENKDIYEKADYDNGDAAYSKENRTMRVRKIN